MATNLRRTCGSNNERGEACRQAPLADRAFCFWHDPESEQDREQARRLGGTNRKRESTLSTIYEASGIRTIEDVQRFVEIALFGTLALDNGIQRNRTLISGALAAAKLLEVGDLAERVEAIESVLGPKLPPKKGRKDGWGRWASTRASAA